MGNKVNSAVRASERASDLASLVYNQDHPVSLLDKACYILLMWTVGLWVGLCLLLSVLTFGPMYYLEGKQYDAMWGWMGFCLLSTALINLFMLCVSLCSLALAVNAATSVVKVVMVLFGWRQLPGKATFENSLYYPLYSAPVSLLLLLHYLKNLDPIFYSTLPLWHSICLTVYLGGFFIILPLFYFFFLIPTARGYYYSENPNVAEQRSPTHNQQGNEFNYPAQPVANQYAIAPAKGVGANKYAQLS